MKDVFVTDVDRLQFAVIVLGILFAIFFIGFIVAVGYIIYTRRKIHGKSTTRHIDRFRIQMYLY